MILRERAVSSLAHDNSCDVTSSAANQQEEEMKVDN